MKWTEQEIKILKENYGKISATKIAKILNKSKGCIYQQAIRQQIHSNLSNPKPFNTLKYQVNENYFSIPTVENCYWAGFIAGDGNLRQNTCNLGIRLQRQDRIILEKFKESVKFTGPIIDLDRFDKRTNKTYYSSDIYISCNIKQWYTDLYNHFNITSKKSLTLKSPNITNFEQQLAYIIGLTDSDGHISIKYSKLRYSIYGTESLLNWIAEIFQKIEKKNKRILYKKNKIYDLTYYSIRAYNILKELEKIQVPFRLERKWNKIKEYEQENFISI